MAPDDTADRPDEGAPLEQKTKSQLQAEADRVAPEPSGAGGQVTKQDLVGAIEEEAPEDTSGRPSLAKVAADQAANRNERVIETQEEE